MSEYSLDEPGFKTPGALVPVPPSSDSSVEAPSDGRRKCIACPWKMSKKTADHHICVLIVEVLIVTLIPVAKSTWSGRRRK